MMLGEKIRVFVRLHFLQILWNFKGMQNLGCLCALRPVLRRIWAGTEYEEAERRHLLYFNTHPYFASICIGVVVKLEEDLKAGTFQKPEMIPLLKNRMSGPLAAVGDAYFWETLRPILASLVVFAVYLFGPGTPQSLLALAGVLAIYIFWVELIRWRGIGWGYQHGLAVVELLKKLDFQGGTRRIRNAGAILLGAATVFYLVQGGIVTARTSYNILQLLLRSALLAVLIVGMMKKISPTILLYLLSAAGFLIGAIA